MQFSPPIFAFFCNYPKLITVAYKRYLHNQLRESFDLDGITEVSRKFFGTLYNTYSFFALYANIDGFTYSEEEIPVEKRTEIDRWIISELNTLIAEVENNYEDYEPTKVSRLVQDFVINKLSNWHIRLSRRRFWKGEYNTDKVSAYQTLYECLNKVAAISSPIAPFFMEQLYTDLNSVSGKYNADSIHLSSFPKSETNKIDRDLEERMDLAQKITTMALSLRKKERVRVRQPLQKIIIPVSGDKMKPQINSVQDILLSELNIKEIEFIHLSQSKTFMIVRAKKLFLLFSVLFLCVNSNAQVEIADDLFDNFEFHQAIKFYVEQNKNINSFFDSKKKGTYSLSEIDEKLDKKIKKVTGNQSWVVSSKITNI